jgi:putative lipoic acid-binding regulatory protein
MTEQKALTFPCDFPIKIFGLSSDLFEATVVGIIRKHVPTISEAAFKINPSKQGKYIALTATIHAESQAQLDAIYQALKACDLVTMTL